MHNKKIKGIEIYTESKESELKHRTITKPPKNSTLQTTILRSEKAFKEHST